MAGDAALDAALATPTVAGASGSIGAATGLADSGLAGASIAGGGQAAATGLLGSSTGMLGTDAGAAGLMANGGAGVAGAADAGAAGGDAVGMGTAATSANDFGMAAPLTSASQVNAGTIAPVASGTSMEFSGPVGAGGGASTGSQSFGATMGKINKAMQLGNTANTMINGAQARPATTTAPMARMSAGHSSGTATGYVPTALPQMTNPTTTMQTMPTMPGTQPLPTAGSSYQTLLANMLANEGRSPMSGLGVGANSYLPGSGGMMNPGYLPPGMY
ncbi:hypothetical protein [Caballeronia zhejiangensis]|uniref:hypothetical protein n=1 Tax=Caballeronia zhejiangensis TaxID=871203 RepID=UPI001F515E59|nr:hypothetical protein [Caballeronia zhejiangensis]MCI1046914.1 hypothetical protein [Caballeronia zhejiangensis]